MFDGRSDNDTKNRFYVLKRAQKRSTYVEDKFNFNPEQGFFFNQYNPVTMMYGYMQPQQVNSSGSYYDDEDHTATQTGSSKSVQSTSSCDSEYYEPNPQSYIMNTNTSMSTDRIVSPSLDRQYDDVWNFLSTDMRES